MPPPESQNKTGRKFIVERVTRGQIVSRGLRNRCPNCGGPGLFKKNTLFTLNPECPFCGLQLERDEGFYLGSMSLNYGVTVVVFLLPILILYLAGILGGLAAALLAGIAAVAAPLAFYRSSRSWWLMSYYYFLPGHLPFNQRDRNPGEDENT